MNIRKWTAKEIYKLVMTPEGLKRAILSLYAKQTYFEKADAQTEIKNGQGFNKPDAGFMSEIATKFLKGQEITIAERRETIRRVQKYIGQLTRIANANEKHKAMQIIASQYSTAV